MDFIEEFKAAIAENSISETAMLEARLRQALNDPVYRQTAALERIADSLEVLAEKAREDFRQQHRRLRDQYIASTATTVPSTRVAEARLKDFEARYPAMKLSEGKGS